MSAHIWFARPGEDVAEAESWDASRATVTWLMSFIAERVDHPAAAARLAQQATRWAKSEGLL